MTLVYIEGIGEAGRIPAIATSLTPDEVAALALPVVAGRVADPFILLPYRGKSACVRADRIIAAVEQ